MNHENRGHKRLTIKQLYVGQNYEEQFTITAKLIEDFARVTGDNNPIHLDEDYAKKTIFKKRVAQGMLGAGLLSGLLGARFPGIGTIYLSQTIQFLKPVFIGDELLLLLEVLEITERKNRVRIKTTFTNQRNETVIRGEAWVMPPS